MTTETEHPELAESPFCVGDWLVDPRLNRLTRGDESIQIELKMMDVLVCLAGRAGEVVSRREIVDTVWATEFITEKTLTRAVAELRRTLGDDAKQPRYIETIHRKGYRLIAPVEIVQHPAATVTPFPALSALCEDDSSPYPGLAAFTEENAEFFFGREAEVTQLWRKISTRRLLAVIGPSGVGKSSLLRAGLMSSATDEWGILICQPDEVPFASLARALAPEFENDSEAIGMLIDIRDEDTAFSLVSRWRQQHGRALLIVDQFEELFTLNSHQVQARFAGLLGRIARKADVHVLLSMRDDFYYRCHEHEALAPVFDSIMPISTPTHAALRRVLVEPAARLDFAFEDEATVEEMVHALEGERGALPLLAFAAARLWEERDRGRRQLTREAYEALGGVHGALARHAEATVAAIGSERLPVVRELFRNLVTAEGTRAVREWDELLSVFSDPQSSSPEEVLRGLIHARLLTSYELRDEDLEGTRRVEIVHESLLDAWPRLVRWRTQDDDAAQLRDELRQAARTWREHDRSDDLLWTDSAYSEFALWRERYPGGLTETEEAFGEAMTHHARRSKRRRRTAVAAVFVTLLGALAIIGSLWRSSVTEARSAAAANLLALAQLQLEDHPSATLAYVIASLELADNPDVRRMALEALWRGPTELRLPARSPNSVDFSPDGRWLLTADPSGGAILWPSDGGPPTALEPGEITGEGRISPSGEVIALYLEGGRETGLWSVPGGRFLRSLPVGGTFSKLFRFSRDGERLVTSTENVEGDSLEVMLQSWPLDGSEPALLARLEASEQSAGTFFGVDPTESMLAWCDGDRFNVAPVTPVSAGPAPSISLQHDRPVTMAVFDDQGQRLATADGIGTIKVWSLDHEPPELIRTVTGVGTQFPWTLRFDPSGTALGTSDGYLESLNAPPDAEPLRLKRPSPRWGVAFHPQVLWLATGHSDSVSLWPLTRPYGWVLRGHEEDVNGVQFTPDGQWIVSASMDGTVRLWPLGSSSGQDSRILYRTDGALKAPKFLTMAPDGSFVAFGTLDGQVVVLPLDGDSLRQLTGFTSDFQSLAIGPQGRLVAAGSGFYNREEAIVRVWDLGSKEVRILDVGDGKWIKRLAFTGDGDLWVASGPMLRRWNLDTGDPRVVEEIDLSNPEFAAKTLHGFNPDSRQALLCDDVRPWIQNIDTREILELGSHGTHGSCSWHADSEIVVSTAGRRALRVGPVTGEEPHLLMGNEGSIMSVAVSSDGRWIASGGRDKTIRVWPMPDFSKPPLHTLPRSELIAKLETLTNLRVARDQESSSGWKLEVGPFPGWDEVPEW